MSGYVNSILKGDALSQLDELPDECIDCVITSPPYWSLRRYNTQMQWPDGWHGELGLEPSFEMYIDHLVQIFNKVQRVLKKEGNCWVVIGDTYGRGDRQTQSKNTFHTNPNRHLKSNPKTGNSKSLIQIPARFAIKMTDNGWILRNDIIWHKRNPMPSSVKDRFAVDYEHIYFFVKSQKYYFETQYEPYSPHTLKEFGQIYTGQGQKDYEEAGVQNPSDVKRRIIAGAQMPPIGGIKNVGRDFTAFDRTYSGNTPNFGTRGRLARAVWTINTQPSTIKHYAVFPEKLVKKILKAACPEEGLVLDPFFGVGTTGIVALKNNRKFVGIEPNEEYTGYAYKRLYVYLYQTKLPLQA